MDLQGIVSNQVRGDGPSCSTGTEVGPMIKIRATTLVQAPMERCFRLALSIDLQMAATHQKAIAGVTQGLIGPGQTVTWQAPRFAFNRTCENLIEVWRPHSYFREVMVAGPFQ